MNLAAVLGLWDCGLDWLDIQNPARCLCGINRPSNNTRQSCREENSPQNVCVCVSRRALTASNRKQEVEKMRLAEMKFQHNAGSPFEEYRISWLPEWLASCDKVLHLYEPQFPQLTQKWLGIDYWISIIIAHQNHLGRLQNNANSAPPGTNWRHPWECPPPHLRIKRKCPGDFDVHLG